MTRLQETIAVPFLVNEWRIDPALNQASHSGRRVHLRPKVMDLLVYLAGRPGEVVSKDMLVEAVWQGEHVSDSALTSVVKDLREALGDDSERPWLLETIPKRGYRLIATVRSVPVARGTSVGQSGLTAAAGVIIVTIALLVGANFLLGQFRMAERPPIRSIAVLQFRALSENRADGQLAEVITDGVISELARLDGLDWVIAHETMRRYSKSEATLSDIADALHVDALVSASLARVNDRVQISVELAHGPTGRQLWSGTYTYDSRDLAYLVREVVRTIVREVRINVSPNQRMRLEARPHGPGETYQLLSQAFTAFRRVELSGAVDLLDQVLARDPELPDAWSTLALVLVYRGYGRPDLISRARAAAEKALELDPRSARARAALGRIRLHVDWDWHGAGRELEQAVDLDPHNPEVRFNYAFYLGVMNRMDEAIRQARELVRLDPLSPQTHFNLGFMLRVAGRPSDAINSFTKAIQLAPDREIYVVQRGFTYALTANCARALADTGGDKDLGPVVAARCGKVKEARAFAAAQRKAGVCRADVYTALGEHNTAFECLEEWFQERKFRLAQIATDILHQDLHADPRFAHLLQRMGYPLR